MLRIGLFVLLSFFLATSPQAEGVTTSFGPCQQVSVFSNLWLVSDHGKKSSNPGKRQLNEKNYGAGLGVACQEMVPYVGLVLHYDQLKNSQFGKTTLLIAAVNLETPKWHDFYAGVRLGKGRITYEVPWANTTLTGYTNIIYWTVGYKKFAFHMAPVPGQSHVKIYFAEWKLATW